MYFCLKKCSLIPAACLCMSRAKREESVAGGWEAKWKGRAGAQGFNGFRDQPPAATDSSGFSNYQPWKYYVRMDWFRHNLYIGTMFGQELVWCTKILSYFSMYCAAL